jgi:hypothetical protein
MTKMPQKYIPKHLSNKDKNKQIKELIKSKNKYYKNKYYIRKKIKSFKSKKSTHVKTAKKLYNVDKIIANKTLSLKTKCKLKSLKKIVNKGKGAYYSSGSRPNQTPHSWGIARLASAITGGPASYIDLHLLKEGCHKNSKSLKLAIKNKHKTKHNNKNKTNNTQKTKHKTKTKTKTKTKKIKVTKK